jgi:ion channel
VLATVAVMGTFGPSGFAQVVISLLLGADLVLACRVAMVDDRVMRLAALVAVCGVAVSVLRATAGVIGEGEGRAMNALVVLFGPPAVALGIIRSLRATRMVTLDAVTGVISLYVMLGLLFAFVFGAIDRLGGDPFFAEGTPATVARCLYFSFTTLTTVGYGDLAARTDLGHTLCVFEMLIGQIYLVTVVSLIVSNLRPPARQRS